MSCPYLETYGVGDYYCTCSDKSIEYDQFKSCCYPNIGYHNCAAWNHLDYYERRIKGTEGAKRSYGDW